jgi:hypothetical protein
MDKKKAKSSLSKASLSEFAIKGRTNQINYLFGLLVEESSIDLVRIMRSSSKSNIASSGSSGVGKKRPPLRRGLVEEVVEGPLRKKRTKEPSKASSREHDDYDSDIDEEAELDDTEYDITESQGAKQAAKGSVGTSGAAAPSGKAKDAKIDAQARKQRSDIHAESMRNKAIQEEDFEGSEVRCNRCFYSLIYICNDAFMHDVL